MTDTTETATASVDQDLRDRMAAAMREAFDQWTALGIDATRGVTREDFFAASALAALSERAWIVPKVPVDANPHVRPYIRGGRIYRYASDAETPGHARFYAAQLLAAADKAEEKS
jgi:hypothetical protein